MNANIPSRENGGQTSPISNDAIAGAVGKLLEHPELISMVASALGGNTSSTAEASTPPAEVSQEQDNTEDTAPVSEVLGGDGADILSSVMPMLSKLSSLNADNGKGGSGFKHEQLLIALKPYVSRGRCEAIDYMLRISRLSGLIGKLR